MQKLIVADRFGKAVNAFLCDGEPFGNADFLADVGVGFVKTDTYRITFSC